MLFGVHESEAVVLEAEFGSITHPEVCSIKSVSNAIIWIIIENVLNTCLVVFMIIGVLGQKSRFIDFVAPIYSGFNNSLEDHTKLTDIAIVVFHVGLSNWLKETRSSKTGYTFVV